MENTVTYFLSTGRSGTQFLAKMLFEHYGDLLAVCHEPFVQGEYRPRENFSRYYRGEQPQYHPNVYEHAQNINEILSHHHFVELGWPAYGAIPHMLNSSTECIRLVHLCRHPLKTAASLTTHDVYGEKNKEWSEKVILRPTDYGVKQSYLADKWDEMSDYHKCLFWYTELHNHALNIHKTFPTVPWLTLKFEDLFYGDKPGVKQLLDFMGLPERETFKESTKERVDPGNFKTDKELDIDGARQYPELMKIMETLGYSIYDGLSDEMAARYKNKE